MCVELILHVRPFFSSCTEGSTYISVCKQVDQNNNGKDDVRGRGRRCTISRLSEHANATEKAHHLRYNSEPERPPLEHP